MRAETTTVTDVVRNWIGVDEMTKERAIDIFRNAHIVISIPHYLCEDGEKADDIAKEALQICQKEIDTQIPRKALFLRNSSDDVSVYKCECGRIIKHYWDRDNDMEFCPTCGQFLDFLGDD